MSPPSYLFARDSRSSIRLNYQHLAIKQLYPFVLHPSVPTNTTTTTDLHVADIGTGTAIWPMEVARQFPSARITGFDLSADQFPRPEWLPPNLSLETHDAFATFPERHHAHYDVVNMRFLVTLLSSDERVLTLVRNLAQLLKPGGYLQWQDASPQTARAIASDVSKSKAATENLAKLMRKPHPGAFYGWIPRLDALLVEGGLHVLERDGTSCAAFTPARALWNQCYLLGYQEISAQLTEKLEVKEDEVKKVNTMIRDLEDEFRDGASMEVEYFCIIAQKGV